MRIIDYLHNGYYELYGGRRREQEGFVGYDILVCFVLRFAFCQKIGNLPNLFVGTTEHTYLFGGVSFAGKRVECFAEHIESLVVAVVYPYRYEAFVCGLCSLLSHIAVCLLERIVRQTAIRALELFG